MRTFNEYKHRESRAEEGLKASKKGAWCVVPPLDGVSAAAALLNAACCLQRCFKFAKSPSTSLAAEKRKKCKREFLFSGCCPSKTTREYINIRNTLMSEIVSMDEKRDQNFQTNGYYNFNWFLIVYTSASLIFM